MFLLSKKANPAELRRSAVHSASQRFSFTRTPLYPCNPHFHALQSSPKLKQAGRSKPIAFLGVSRKQQIPNSPFAFRQRGFALVVSLTLMILLTVLSIGLLSLSTISLRASSQGEAMQIARSNARMGMILAIGQLQKTAGSDQRITAPARLVEDSAPAWLGGVWSGKLDTAAEPASDKDAAFRGYLVSGSENRSSLQASDLPDLSTGSLLVGEGSLGVGTDPDSFVRAPKVDLAAAGKGVVGRYSWGILDEGVKAKVDLVRKSGNFGAASRQAAMGSPARFGMESIAGLEAYDWFESTELSRLITLPTSRLMEGMPSLPPFQQDITTVHRGLITDAARGGLREDLSLLFAGTTLPAAFSNKRLYDDPAVLTESPNPFWSQLFEYSTLYRKTSNINGTPALKASVPSGYNPVRYDPRSRSNKVNPQAPRGLLLMPVVAKVQMQFSLVAKDAHGNWGGGTDRNFSTPDDNYMVYMIYSPIVTLYNPYNIPLTFDELRIDFKDLPIGFRFYRNGQPQTTRLAHFNQLYVYHDSDTKVAKTFGINLRSAFTSSRAAPVVMEPGENLVFGESVSGAATWNTGGMFDWQDNLTANIPLAPGYPSQGVGFWVDWLTPPAMITPFDDKMGIYTLKLTDTVDVEFAPLPSEVSGNRLSIELNLMQGSRKLRSGALDLEYGDVNRLTTALSKDPATKFPARLQRPYLGSEIYETPATKLKDYSRAKAFALFSFYGKTTMESDSATKPWIQGSHATSLVGIDLTKESMSIHPSEVALKRVAPGFRFPIDAQNRGKFFTGNGENTGTRIAPQYEVPMLPLQSIAQLRHAGLANQGFLPGATYTAGESFATPNIGPSAVSATGTKDYRMLDHAWFANNALWDRYFFSTLAPHEGPQMSAKSLKEISTGFIENGESLLNPRMILAGSNLGPDLADRLNAAQGYVESASHLMIDGAFNVNSASIPAWKALLSSMNQEDVEYFHVTEGAASGKVGEVKKASHPFSRMRRASGPAVESFNAIEGRHGRWTGMRTLTDAEITTLATNIVEEVKERGPFLSIAEFVNRKPGIDKKLALKGALQAAIDRTESINARFMADSKMYTAAQAAADGSTFPEALEGMSAVGAPGYLTQGDILSSIGSVISVRSDTFRIRSYGESVDPSNKVTARAWCEAVVQRIPEFVDPTDQPQTATAALNETNVRFGRRFKIIGFRWLSPEEV